MDTMRMTIIIFLNKDEKEEKNKNNYNEYKYYNFNNYEKLKNNIIKKIYIFS